MSKENEKNLILSKNTEFDEDQKDPQTKGIDIINKDKLKESNDSSRSTVMNSNIKIDDINKSFNQKRISSDKNKPLQPKILKDESNYLSNFFQPTIRQNLNTEYPYRTTFNKIQNNNCNLNTIKILSQNTHGLFPNEKQQNNNIGNFNQYPPPFESGNNMTTNIMLLHNIDITTKTLLSIFKDQISTKDLQNMLNENTPKEIISSIVEKLTGTYLFILKDKNGNYFLSNLIKNCQQYQRVKILKELSKTIIDDCIDKYATHPLQTIIEYSLSDEEFNLIMFSFTDYNKVFFASLDPNGSYVIKKILEHIPEKHKTKFNLLFITFIHFIITKKYGVVVAKNL